MTNKEKISAMSVLNQAADLAYLSIGDYSLLGLQLEKLRDLISNELNEES